MRLNGVNWLTPVYSDYKAKGYYKNNKFAIVGDFSESLGNNGYAAYISVNGKPEIKYLAKALYCYDNGRRVIARALIFENVSLVDGDIFKIRIEGSSTMQYTVTYRFNSTLNFECLSYEMSLIPWVDRIGFNSLKEYHFD